MGRKAHELSPEVLAEARRFIREGRRHYAVAGEPPNPSFRDIAQHLAQTINPSTGGPWTDDEIHPDTLRRILSRAGIILPRGSRLERRFPVESDDRRRAAS